MQSSNSLASSFFQSTSALGETPLWLFDNGLESGFQRYSDDLVKQLEASLLSGQRVSSFSVGQQNYEVDLHCMVQRNTKTDVKRAVVRLLLKSTHAVLDRDCARVFKSMTCKDLMAWIEAHTKQPACIDQSCRDKGALMTKATTIFHSSCEFPVLLCQDGSPLQIRNKSGKVIRGGAKPTKLDSLVVAPTKSPILQMTARRTVYDMAWAVSLVKSRDGDDLASRIIKVDDLSDRCQPLMEQFYAFKKMMPHDAIVSIVFHGTSLASVPKIIKSGFDFRLNQRAMYGKGNYFAVNAQYSLGVAEKNPYGEKVIIVTSIVHSKVARGTSAMLLPPDGFDATVDDDSRPSIYVTYKVMRDFEKSARVINTILQRMDRVFLSL